MNREEILSKIARTIQDVLDTDATITEQTSASDIDGWDSLTHIQIISTIEKEFSLRFALGELQSLKNIEDTMNLILEKQS
jgi:acyl carrier protein